MKRNVLIMVIVLLIVSLGLTFFFFRNSDKTEVSINDKLKEIGYSDKDISLILDKVSSDGVDEILNIGYDESLIDILSSSNYDENKFSDYIEYYMKNKDENIKDIIGIVNSGFDLFNYPAIAVDTHVARVSKRLNLAKTNDDVITIEKKLMKKFKKDVWSRRHHQLVLFGRYHCKAIKPNCSACKLKDVCKYNQDLL